MFLFLSGLRLGKSFQEKQNVHMYDVDIQLPKKGTLAGGSNLGVFAYNM